MTLYKSFFSLPQNNYILHRHNTYILENNQRDIYIRTSFNKRGGQDIKSVLIVLLLVTFLLSISTAFAISIPSLSQLFATDTYRVFEMSINNNNTNALSAVNWTFDTKDNNVIIAQQLANLGVAENVSVYIEYNYSTRGQFTTNATAFNDTLTDSEMLTVTINDIAVSQLQRLHLDNTEMIFEIIINNTGTNTLTDINWTLNTSDGNLLTGNTLFNLTSLGNILVFVDYNYSAIGKYNITASVFNPIFTDAKTVTFKTNSSPVVSLLPDVTILEDGFNDTINLNDFVIDEDTGSDLRWTAMGNSSNTVRISILQTGIMNISGAPDYNTQLIDGINITFIVTDSDAIMSNDTILVTIVEFNDPPNITTFTPISLEPSISVGKSLQFNHTSTDPDAGDPLTYTWYLDDINQSFASSWLYQPTKSDEGVHVVNLTVSDGLLHASLRWNLTVYISYCNDHYNSTDTEWIVTSSVTCANETIPLTADITVQNGGSLTFRNTTLTINNSVEGEHGISVHSGGQSGNRQ